MSKSIFPEMPKTVQEYENAYLLDKFNELKKLDNSLVIEGYIPWYFLFQQSILIFRSSKLKDNYAWRFGLWAKYDKEGKICGVIYIGDAEEFVDKFKPLGVPISTENPNEFISLIKELEDSPKEQLIKYYFKDEVELTTHFENKKLREIFKTEALSICKQTLTKIFKDYIPELKGISILTGEYCSPMFDTRIWISPKLIKYGVANKELWAKILDAGKYYNSIIQTKLKTLENSNLWYFLSDFEVTIFPCIVTNQDKLAEYGGNITIWSKKKKVRHRNIMLEKARKYTL